MVLTEYQQNILNGKEGEVKAKVMRTLVLFGEAFSADSLVPLTCEHHHFSFSAGLGIFSPVYELFQQLIESGATAKNAFSVNPRPIDKTMPGGILQSVLLNTFIYNEQGLYENQLKWLGIEGDEAFRCACHMGEADHPPKKGEVLSWSGPSAVIYANSVLGARSNRNAPPLDLFGAIVGCVPRFGLLTDEGRRASWIVKVETSELPDAQLLGSAIGRKVGGEIPYIYGLDRFLGGELTDAVKAYLKDFGAAAAAVGTLGLYHIDGVTPEAKEMADGIIEDAASVYTVDDGELFRVRENYETKSENAALKPKLCVLGCPHLSMQQLRDFTDRLEEGLLASGNRRVQIPTVFTAPIAVLRVFEKTEYAERLRAMGVVTSHICPAAYLQNPISAKISVISPSAKLCQVMGARYYTEGEIVELLTKGESAL